MSDQPSLPEENWAGVVARPMVAAAGEARAVRYLAMPGVGRWDAALDLTLIVAVAVALPYLPGALIPADADTLADGGLGARLAAEKWGEVGAAGALMAYLLFRRKLRPAAFGLRLRAPGRQALWGLGALVGLYAALAASTVVVLALFMVLPSASEEIEKRIEFISALPIDNLRVQVLLLVAVAIGEETVFRGLLLPYLKRMFGSWWVAGFLSSLLFALLHIPGQGVLAGVQVFAIAAALTTFFILSRSLLAVTVAHFLFDFLQFQLIRLLPDPREMMDAAGL